MVSLSIYCKICYSIICNLQSTYWFLSSSNGVWKIQGRDVLYSSRSIHVQFTYLNCLAMCRKFEGSKLLLSNFQKTKPEIPTVTVVVFLLLFFEKHKSHNLCRLLLHLRRCWFAFVLWWLPTRKLDLKLSKHYWPDLTPWHYFLPWGWLMTFSRSKMSSYTQKGSSRVETAGLIV